MKERLVRSYLMTWIPKLRRWVKRYRGRQYTVSCRQLGCEESKEASWRLANEWWREQLTEHEKDNRKPTPGSPEAQQALLEAWAGQPIETPEKAVAILQELTAHFRDRPFPPEVSEAVLGKEEVARLESGAKGLLDDPGVPVPQTVGRHFGEWFEGQKAKVAAGEIAPDRADSNRVMLQHFVTHLGADSPVESITEVVWRNFSLHCRARIATKAWSPTYAGSILRVARSFVRSLWESNLIPLPRNLQSRDLTIKIKAKKKLFFEPSELKQQIDAAHGPMKLHLLLMANCGCYQSDIAELRQDEVDWQAGTITRKRSKTDDREDTPTVRWKLWPVTFELLKKHRSRHSELALLTNRGKPWVEKRLRDDGKLSKTDKIVSNYRRLVDVTGIRKPLKSIRKTSANLLESHREYAKFTPYFLGHAEASIKEKHYTDVSDLLFFEALDWLRQQYGL